MTRSNQRSKSPTSSAPWCAALLLSTLATLALAAPAAAQTPSQETAAVVPDVPVIAVSGQGEVRAEPDEATVSLGVTAQAETAGAAQQEANRIAGRILDAVGALGIEDKAVQTSSINLYPVYADPSRRPQQVQEDEPRIVGYRASNVVSVRLADLAKIGPVIDATVAAGANQVQGVRFELRDDQGERLEALTRSVAAARAKAEALASALGMRLGPVLRAEEAGVSIDVPRFDRAPVAMMRMEASSSTPVSAGEITVSAGVNLLYRLLPAGG